MKQILFILLFILSGCIGYTNTSRYHSDINSAPFNTGVVPYLDMHKYTIADIKKINSNLELVSEYSDGDMHYIEYSAPRATRPKWLGFVLIIPIYIPKFSSHNDTIRFVFQDGFLTGIDFDYYREREKIYPLVPLDCWGNLRPSSPVRPYRGGGYEYDGPCFDKTEYINTFMDTDIGCAFPTITDNNHWNIDGLNFVPPFQPEISYKKVPIKSANSEIPKNSYYDYKCTDDNCVKMLCVGDTCEPASASAEPAFIEPERLYGLSCSHISALNVNGTIYHNYNGNYVIQVINAPHINRERAIEYASDNAQSKTMENINGIEMTLIQKTNENDKSNIAIFFDDNKIYMIGQNTKLIDDDTDFKQLLHTVGIDPITVPQN